MENPELALIRKYMIHKKIDVIVGRNRLSVRNDLILTLFSFYNCSTFLFLTLSHLTWGLMGLPAPGSCFFEESA
jgi:hypothetical protein